MKAPSVREGSKENGTQVTGNGIYKGCLVCKSPLADQVPIPQVSASFPGSASRDGKKLVNRFMEANPRLRPGVDPQKFPRCRSCPGDGADPLVSFPNFRSAEVQSYRFSITQMLIENTLPPCFAISKTLKLPVA